MITAFILLLAVEILLDVVVQPCRLLQPSRYVIFYSFHRIITLS